MRAEPGRVDYDFVLTDAGHGADGAFRSCVTAAGLSYVVGVQSTLSVWPPDTEPLPPRPSRVRREGSNVTMPSRFAVVRIRPASRDWKRAAPHPLEWLLIEWPQGEKEPTRYWLSNLPEDTPIAVLVDTAKLRWRIERDCEELKSELGLAHFEGRSWRGFHHHAALCIAA